MNDKFWDNPKPIGPPAKLTITFHTIYGDVSFSVVELNEIYRFIVDNCKSRIVGVYAQVSEGNTLSMLNCRRYWGMILNLLQGYETLEPEYLDEQEVFEFWDGYYPDHIWDREW